jgi:hypothetical protein
MKQNEQFNKIFRNMTVEKAKEWRTTTCSFPHKNKKKEANKKACRRGYDV